MELPALDEKIWRPFFIEEIFDILPGKRLTKAEMIAGNTPFIGASDSNNGVTAFVGNNNDSADENFLSVSYNGSVCQCFYHPYRCLCSDDVKRFHLKNRAGNKYIYLFLANSIKQQKSKYNYGYKFNEARMRRQKIMLPVDDSGAPDYDFMENYIRASEEKILQRYREYITELDRLPLSMPIPSLNEKIWRPFNLSDVFSIRATSSGIDKNKLKPEDGEYPYVTRTDRNNGIQCFVCAQPDYKLDDGNCITVGLDTQTAFYQPTAFYTGQNIQILRNDRLNKNVAQFILPLLKKTLSVFSWGGNGATLTRLRRSKIQLPVDDSGAPDFDYMEAYIKKIFAEKYRRYLEYIG
ncbi:MAG: restriction endonuclease subunit S [Selenomonadaceae bacterium]|nr:restriction endonuclease subunit S [Selenomonadaceae bacterium]MBQ9496846.1 restriction endonuclease subunit S [Selenomonadaceae bacterium]